eukprot:TRINITY_DN5046_c0_g1_i1.p2 TRINITY_DN5046_c0_g1~~TRINITY_DN5046_c0_g1_i1.p2  ORF type:complete len:123 (+),score=28.49 TRINITY_DN5046_c0_g1_i1:133-501(+)
MCIRDRSYNWISSLAGIENLKNLKVLYLGNNHINKFRELHRLVELPDLQELVLYGNPIHTESVERNGEINWASSVLAVPTLQALQLEPQHCASEVVVSAAASAQEVRWRDRSGVEEPKGSRE